MKIIDYLEINCQRAHDCLAANLTSVCMWLCGFFLIDLNLRIYLWFCGFFGIKSRVFFN